MDSRGRIGSKEKGSRRGEEFSKEKLRRGKRVSKSEGDRLQILSSCSSEIRGSRGNSVVVAVVGSTESRENGGIVRWAGSSENEEGGEEEPEEESEGKGNGGMSPEAGVLKILAPVWVPSPNLQHWTHLAKELSLKGAR